MSRAILGTYFPEAVTIILSWTADGGGSHIVQGGAEGSFCNVRQMSDSVNLRRGVGSSMRTRWLNKDVEVDLTIQQTSGSNDVLARLIEKDEQAQDNSWLFSLMIVDNSGRNKLYCSQAFISRRPDIDYTTEGTDLSWTIYGIDSDAHIGGADQLDQAMVEALANLGYDVDDRWKA